MDLSELEFKIFSSCLVEIGKIIRDIELNPQNYKSLNDLSKTYIEFGVQPYLGAGALLDVVVFDKKKMRFTKIQYRYFDKKTNSVISKEIGLPEFLPLNVYV